MLTSAFKFTLRSISKEEEQLFTTMQTCAGTPSTVYLKGVMTDGTEAIKLN